MEPDPAAPRAELRSLIPARMGGGTSINAGYPPTSTTEWSPRSTLPFTPRTTASLPIREC